MPFALRLHPAVIVLATALLAAPMAHADYVKPALEHAPYEAVRVVVPITSADPAVWRFRLNNVNAGLTASKEGHGSLQARVVLYGGGVKLLSSPVDPQLKEMIDGLRDAGVQFSICNNTLKGMNADWHSLYGVKEADIVPSGFLEVGWLASHGWAVDPMN